jgi:hypothetical protein
MNEHYDWIGEHSALYSGDPGSILGRNSLYSEAFHSFLHNLYFCIMSWNRWWQLRSTSFPKLHSVYHSHCVTYEIENVPSNRETNITFFHRHMTILYAQIVLSPVLEHRTVMRPESWQMIAEANIDCKETWKAKQEMTEKSRVSIERLTTEWI